MRKIFTGLVISHTNDFSSNKNDKIQGWIEHNGGIYSKDVTPNVTHIITSLKSWKRLPGSLREIRRQRRVKIVKLDWLLDCLKTAKPRRLDESEYYYEKFKPKPLGRTKRKAETEVNPGGTSKRFKTNNHHDDKIERAGREFDKACQKTEKEMAAVGFHPYQDKTGLVHMINLVRKDILRNLLDKHKLQLYESDTQPHTYACITQYTQHRKKEITTEELAPVGSTFEFALTLFRKFFDKRCGPWTDVSTKTVRKIDRDGTGGDDSVWTYQLHDSATLSDMSTYGGAKSQNLDDEDTKSTQQGQCHTSQQVRAVEPTTLAPDEKLQH